MATKNDIILSKLIDVQMDPKRAYDELSATVGRGVMVFRYQTSPRLPKPIGQRMHLRGTKFVTLDVSGRETLYADPTGARKEHSDRTQHEMLLRTCYAVANAHKGKPSASPSATPTPVPTPPVPAPVPQGPKDSFDVAVERYLTAIAKMRDFVKARSNFDPLDSYRLEEDGIKLLAEGLPVEGLLCSIAAAWSKDSRSQFTEQTGITLDFDYQAWGRANGAPKELPGESEYLYRVLKAGVFAYCHGPSQIGKSYGLKYAAERLAVDAAKDGVLDFDYYETCVPGAMPSALKGKFVGPDHYVDSSAKKAYRNSGLFNIDEIDFGEPDVLGAINNSVTNGVWHCDVTGERIVKADWFRMAATANTLGNGTDKRFQRNVIDGATQERFRLGRIEFKHDRQIASKIAADQVAAAKQRMAA